MKNELKIKGLKGSAVKKEIERYMTQTIIDAINSDSSGHWSKSWKIGKGGQGNLPQNQDGTIYNGWNQFHLSSMAAGLGYDSNVWGTFKNWKTKGYFVQKGSKSVPVIFAKYVFEDNIETGKSEFKYFVYKVYNVFNASQVADKDKNLASDSKRYTPKPVESVEFTNKLCKKVSTEYLTSQNIGITGIGGNRSPYYNSGSDVIGMPALADFIDTKDATAEQNYFSTLFHEIGHSTGHESRLNRPLGNKFGNENYAFEELIAELTAVFISGHTGLEPTPALNHTSYIKSWNDALKDDPRTIIKAMNKASKASQFFLDNTSLKIAKPEPAEEVKQEPVKFETVALITRSA